MTAPGPWAADAACAGDADPVWITLPRDSSRGAIEAARAVCRDCPVILQCGTWAAREPGFAGIAAGRTWNGAARELLD